MRKTAIGTVTVIVTIIAIFCGIPALFCLLTAGLGAIGSK